MLVRCLSALHFRDWRCPRKAHLYVKCEAMAIPGTLVEATSSRSRGLLAAAAVTVGLSILAMAWLPQTLLGVFSTRFLPHVYCYLYDKKLIALHVGSDAAIWISYVAISVTLTYLVYRTRREIPFSWMFLAFGTFIIACGFTHLMEVVVLWKPLYWLSGD